MVQVMDSGYVSIKWTCTCRAVFSFSGGAGWEKELQEFKEKHKDCLAATASKVSLVELDFSNLSEAQKADLHRELYDFITNKHGGCLSSLVNPDHAEILNSMPIIRKGE